jgi:glutamate-1-semialdehyde 2,1-aminomutase
MSTHAKIMAGGLPGGAVVGRAEILDMIQHRGDSEWDLTRRVAHPGTFNANPLSASAGITALGIIAAEPVNDRVDALTERLKTGLNGVLSQGETSGFAYNVCSNLFVALGLEEELDPDGICVNSHDSLREANDPQRMAHLRKALLNEGVDVQGGWSWRPSAAHTEADVDFTVAAFDRALHAMRQEGALAGRESVSSR